MYDTIRGRIGCEWIESIGSEVPQGWEIRTGLVEGKDNEHHTIRTAVHKESGMYIKGDDRFTHIIQVSLPRLLHGDNTELIKNQDELDVAWDKFRLLQREVLKFDQIPRWTRLDIVWNFLGSIDDYITAFQNSKHPRVRSAVRVYKGQSIQWGGKVVTIQIYDKLQEKKRCKTSSKTIVRAEVRQRVNPSAMDRKDDPFFRLCEPCLGGYLPTFKRGYRYYRDVMIELSPKQIPQLASRSPLDFLAYLEANNLTNSEGISLVEIYMNGKSRAQKYKIMKELKGRVLRHKFISFRELLPLDHAPQPIGLTEAKIA